MNILSLANKTITNSSKQQNYKQMYEQVKKNTSVFIKMVESEVSKMLLQHKKEKMRLEKENFMLKEQIKNQEKQFRTSQTYRKDNANTSSTNVFEENTRDFMNCGISEIGHL